MNPPGSCRLTTIPRSASRRQSALLSRGTEHGTSIDQLEGGAARSNRISCSSSRARRDSSTFAVDCLRPARVLDRASRGKGWPRTHRKRRKIQGRRGPLSLHLGGTTVGFTRVDGRRASRERASPIEVGRRTSDGFRGRRGRMQRKRAPRARGPQGRPRPQRSYRSTPRWARCPGTPRPRRGRAGRRSTDAASASVVPDVLISPSNSRPAPPVRDLSSSRQATVLYAEMLALT